MSRSCAERSRRVVRLVMARPLLRPRSLLTALIRRVGICKEAEGAIESLRWIVRPPRDLCARSTFIRATLSRDSQRGVVPPGRALLWQVEADLRGFSAKEWAQWRLPPLPTKIPSGSPRTRGGGAPAVESGRTQSRRG